MPALNPAPPDRGDSRLVENLMYFARTLRAAGMPVGPGKVIDAIRAVQTVGVGNRADFYWALHAVFVNRRDQKELFDQAFHVFWRNPQFLERMMQMMLPALRMPADEATHDELMRRLAEALHPTAVEGLLVMPAGTARENPIRTLSSPTLPVVLQDLANVADVVLIDSPPCVTVPDASIIAPSADGTILLLRAGETDRRTAQRARSIMTAVGASVLGVILNRASVGLEGFSYARRYRRATPPALGPGA